MEQYSLGDEGALPSEMPLPSFSESQGLNCSDTLNRDLGPDTRDLLYTGLGGLDLDPSLPAPDAPNEALEDNLDALSLYSGKDSDSGKLLEESVDPEAQVALQGEAVSPAPRQPVGRAPAELLPGWRWGGALVLEHFSRLPSEGCRAPIPGTGTEGRGCPRTCSSALSKLCHHPTSTHWAPRRPRPRISTHHLLSASLQRSGCRNPSCHSAVPKYCYV